MNRIDYRKVYKEAYTAPTRGPVLLKVPPMNFLMLDGQGDPGREVRFRHAIEALFGLAYAIKFAIRKGPMALDLAVMPLEGLWWSEDMAHFAERRDLWRWRLMIMQPPVVYPETLEQARRTLAARKPLALLEEVRLARFEEGSALQLLHVGPFVDEGPAVGRLWHYAEEHSLQPRGHHHEIYLTDIRKAAPEKWKTILRQPVSDG